VNARELILRLHRYVGLAIAAFLVVIGLTGSIIVFNPELARWLDPPPRIESAGRPMLDGIALRERAQAIEPRALFNTANLHLAADEAVPFFVEPRIDPASGKPATLGYDLLYLDPYTGGEVRRESVNAALWPVTRKNVLALINRLHYALAIPGNWGGWLFGGVALLWTLDCLWSVYLTFPARRRKAGRGPAEAARRSWLARW